jgi:hypothetical protein
LVCYFVFKRWTFIYFFKPHTHTKCNCYLNTEAKKRSAFICKRCAFISDVMDLASSIQCSNLIDRKYVTYICFNYIFFIGSKSDYFKWNEAQWTWRPGLKNVFFYYYWYKTKTDYVRNNLFCQPFSIRFFYCIQAHMVPGFKRREGLSFRFQNKKFLFAFFFC